MESNELLSKIQTEWEPILKAVKSYDPTNSQTAILSNPKHIKAVMLSGEKLTIAIRYSHLLSYLQRSRGFSIKQSPTQMQIEIKNVTGFMPEIEYIADEKYFTAEIEAEKKEQKERAKIEEQAKIERHQQRVKDMVKLLFKHSRIPFEKQSDGFANFEVRHGTEKAYAAALYYCAVDPKVSMAPFESELFDCWNSHPFITFWGPCGSGKTCLAFAIGNQYCKYPEAYDIWIDVDQGWGMNKGPDRGVLYYQVEELLDELKKGFEDGSYNKLLETVKEAGLLILDDIGAEKHTEWADAKLDEIIDYRYEHEKDTVFTTNVNPDKLPKRIASRMSEGVEVLMDATDYRLIKSERRAAAKKAVTAK